VNNPPNTGSRSAITRLGPGLALTLLAALAAGTASRAQRHDAGPVDKEEKGTYLGALLGPVPDVLYDHLPDLARGQGVVITHVLPESPAAKAGLQRHDLLVQYGDEKVRGCEHCARLIQSDKPEHKVKLALIRAGRPTTAEVTLALGPVLRVVQADKASPVKGEPGAKEARTDANAGNAANPGNAVNVAATPLGGGNLKVTIEYYQEGTGRLRSLTCTGTPNAIEGEMQKLPIRVQNLAKVALQRIKALDLPSAAQSPSSR
jgi:hypothetical protein